MVEPGVGHALAHAAVLDEGPLERPDLAVEQAGRHLDEPDDHVGADGGVKSTGTTLLLSESPPLILSLSTWRIDCTLK